MSLTVERAGKRFDTTVIPNLSERSGVGSAGWDEHGQIQLGEVQPGLPADKAGLKTGDLILTVNGQPMHSLSRFHEITEKSAGMPIEIEFERAGQKKSVTVQPTYAKIDGPARWMIGVIPVPKYNVVNVRLSFPDALHESLRRNGKGALLIVNFLKGMVERRMSPKNITGPIGIAQLSGWAAREGVGTFVALMSDVSLNLAIFNLLPIPILDGGVILMLLVEMTMQRDLSLSVKEVVFKVGFVFIMVLVAFVIYNDIAKMLPAG
jgi:regulator of sigma E protease